MLSRMNFLFFITGPYQMGEIFAEFGLQTES